MQRKSKDKQESCRISRITISMNRVIRDRNIRKLTFGYWVDTWDSEIQKLTDAPDAPKRQMTELFLYYLFTCHIVCTSYEHKIIHVINIVYLQYLNNQNIFSFIFTDVILSELVIPTLLAEFMISAISTNCYEQYNSSRHLAVVWNFH